MGEYLTQRRGRGKRKASLFIGEKHGSDEEKSERRGSQMRERRRKISASPNRGIMTIFLYKRGER